VSRTFLLLATVVLGGCAATPAPPATSVTPAAVQPTEAAPADAKVEAEALPQGVVAGAYDVELVGDEVPFEGQKLHLDLRHNDGMLEAECTAGRTMMSGSAESHHPEKQHLAVSVMGLSASDDSPVALRLVTESSDNGALTGTAIVEQGGAPIMLRFIARRTTTGRPSAAMCGELVYQHETHYYGPAGHDDVTTRRYERCVRTEGRVVIEGGRKPQ
jgi:hypothetical protein